MTLRKNTKSVLLAATIAALFAALPASAGDELKGMITKVQGDSVTIRDSSNATQTFTVSADTKFKKTKGLTGMMFDTVEKGALMPGLPVKVEIEDGMATEVSFKSEDLKTAQQVSAGLAPTHERMDNFGTYDAIATAEVLFASGKTTINDQGKSDLRALAAKAKDTKDYRVVLQGFTDSVGDAKMNQRLSTMRAAAVANFLQQKAGLSPGRVMTPDGMGIAADAGSGDNANARKVVAKLVIDKGVHGSQ